MNITESTILPGHQHPIYSICNSQKPHIFFTGGGEAAVVEWSLKTMAHIKVLFKVKGSIYTMHCPAEPNVLIAGDRSGTITVFDFQEQKVVHTLQQHRGAVFQIQSVGDTFFSVAEDGTLCKWSLEDFSLIQSKQISNEPLRALAVNPSASQLAIGGKDSLIRIVDIETMEIMRTIEGHSLGIFSLRFSPGGTYLLSGARDAQLKIWNANDDFSLRETIAAHLFSINDIIFLKDSSYFATASRDKSIKVWNIDDLKLYKIISMEKMNAGHRLSVNQIIFNSFKDQLISVSDDKMVMVFDVTM